MSKPKSKKLPNNSLYQLSSYQLKEINEKLLKKYEKLINKIAHSWYSLEAYESYEDRLQEVYIGYLHALEYWTRRRCPDCKTYEEVVECCESEGANKFIKSCIWNIRRKQAQTKAEIRERRGNLNLWYINDFNDEDPQVALDYAESHMRKKY